MAVSTAALSLAQEQRTIIDSTATLAQAALLYIIQAGIEMAANQSVNDATSYYRKEIPTTIEPWNQIATGVSTNYYTEMRAIAQKETGIKYGEMVLFANALDLAAPQAKTYQMVNVGIKNYSPLLLKAFEFGLANKKEAGIALGVVAGTLTLIEIAKHVDFEPMQRFFSGIAKKSVQMTSEETIKQYVSKDKFARRSRRVTRTANACAWCVFMAWSNPEQYPDFHDWCNCAPGVEFEGESDDKYKSDIVDKFEADYRKASGMIRNGEWTEGASVRRGTPGYEEALKQELKGPARSYRKDREQEFGWDDNRKAYEREKEQKLIDEVSAYYNQVDPSKVSRNAPRVLNRWGVNPDELVSSSKRGEATQSSSDVMSVLRREFGWR